MSEPSGNAVEVRDLVKRYPKQKINAVDGLSFDVHPGEIFGLLGPNGAGKTTTVGVLTTRVAATAGEARLQAGSGPVRRSGQPDRRVPTDRRSYGSTSPQSPPRCSHPLSPLSASRVRRCPTSTSANPAWRTSSSI